MYHKITRARIILGSLAATKAAIFILILLTFVPLEHMHLAALGASAFATFSAPQAPSGHALNLIGSYFISIIVGILCCLPFTFNWISPFPYFQVILASLSVGISMVILMATHLEHPPAAGVALGFIISPWNGLTPIVLMVSISGLVAYRYFLTLLLNKLFSRTNIFLF